MQLESEGAPAVFENVPVAQGTQVRKVVAPVFDENVPVGQDMQRVAWPLE